MKVVKNYENFAEDYRLNENLLKKAWDKIADFFRKKYKKASWLYYALYLKKIGELPKEKVEIFSPDLSEDDIDVKEIELATESLKNSKISTQRLNEEQVSLSSNDPNIRNVDVDELKEEILDIFKMNLDRVEEGKPRTKNDALFIWGAPGIGKTEILQQVAKELGATVIEFHLATIDPTDFRGVPKIEMKPGGKGPEDERTVSKIPGVFPTDNGPNDKGGILFFDEFNRAKQMVLSAALPLTLNGRIGEYVLPEKWIVVAAGNRPEDLGGAVATSIEPALANRFAHVNYAPTLENWIAWAIDKKDINPDLIGFLQFNKGYFHKLDPEQDNKMNWPSPRTWEMASKKDYFKRGKNWKNKLPLPKVQAIYTDLVGAEAAIAFVEYLKLKEVFSEKDIESVYTKGKDAKKPPERLDIQRAVSSAIAFYKKGEKLTEKELRNVLDWTISLADMEGKTSMLMFFKMAHPEVKTDPIFSKIWWEYIKKWHIEMKELENK